MSEYEDASFNEYVRTEIAKRDAEIASQRGLVTSAPVVRQI